VLNSKGSLKTGSESNCEFDGESRAVFAFESDLPFELAHERVDQLQTERWSVLQIDTVRNADAVVPNDENEPVIPVVQVDVDLPLLAVGEGVFE